MVESRLGMHERESRYDLNADSDRFWPILANSMSRAAICVITRLSCSFCITESVINMWAHFVNSKLLRQFGEVSIH